MSLVNYSSANHVGCVLILLPIEVIVNDQCDQKKSPNVCKSCPKMIDFDTFRNVGELGKLIVAKAYKKLPKVQ